MAKPKQEEDDYDNDNDEDNQRAVFIDTSLNTHIVILVSLTDTFSALKEKIEIEHSKSFPSLGEIKVGALKVKRRGHYYHLMESLLVKDVFSGVEKNWFVFADASSQIVCSQTPLIVHNANVPARAAKLSTGDGSVKPSASLVECDEGDRLGMYSSNANNEVPTTIVNKCKASVLPNADMVVGKILDDGSAWSKKQKRNKKKRKRNDEGSVNSALDDVNDMAVDHARDTKANGSQISDFEERQNNKVASGLALKSDMHQSNGEKVPSSIEWPLKKIGDNEDFHSGPALKKCKFGDSNHDTFAMSKADMQKVESVLGKAGPQLSELPVKDGRDNHFVNIQGEAEMPSQMEGTSINLAKTVNNENLDNQVGAPPQSRAKKIKKAKRIVAVRTTESQLPANVSDGQRGDVLSAEHKCNNIFDNQPKDGSPESQAKKTKKAKRSVVDGTNESPLPAKVSDALKGHVFSTEHESNTIHNQPKDRKPDGQANKKKKARSSVVTGTNENLLSDKVSDGLKGDVSSAEHESNIINKQLKDRGAVDEGTAVQMNSDAKILCQYDTLVVGAKERGTIENVAVLKSPDIENSLDSGYTARKGNKKKTKISVSEKPDLSSTNTHQSNGIDNQPKTSETTDARTVVQVNKDVKLLLCQDDPFKSVPQERETIEHTAASKSIDAKDQLESGYTAKKGKNKKTKNLVSEKQDLSNTSAHENNVVENQVKSLQNAYVGTAVQENNDAVLLLGQGDPLNSGSRGGKTIEDSAASKSLHVKDSTESSNTAKKKKTKKERNSVSGKQDLSTPIAHEKNLFDNQPNHTETADAGTAVQVNNESKLLLSQDDPVISVTRESETKDTSSFKSPDRKNNMELGSTAKKGKTKKAKNPVPEMQELSSTNGHHGTPSFATVGDHVKYGSNEAATEFLKTKDGNGIRDLEISKKKNQKTVKNRVAEEHLKDQSHEAANSKTSEGHRADSRLSGAPTIKVLGNVDKMAHEKKKAMLPEKKLDCGNLSAKRPSHTDTGKVVNAYGQRNGHLGTPSAIFDDASSSSEGGTGVGSETSTSTPSDIASSSSEGESKGEELTSGSSEKGRKDNKKPNSSELKNLTLESIFKSSSRFKKAKLAASQSQLDSEPFEFVPDSQPYF